MEWLIVRGVLSGRRFPVVVGSSRLTDLASTNGTFVNGQELMAKSIVLHKHDLITLGESTDLIVLPSHAAERCMCKSQSQLCHLHGYPKV